MADHPDTPRATPQGFPMAPRPVGGAAAWHGADLRDAYDWIYHLTDADVAELEAAMATTKARNLDTLAITREDFPLPLSQHNC